MARVLIALGSNVGSRRETLDRAVELLRYDGRFKGIRLSHWRETQPVGGPSGQQAFLNGALVCQTPLTPIQVMAVLGRIENALGRTRAERWDARTLDLDLLLYGDEVVRTSEIQVPHPRMAFRGFVLRPAAEIAPDMLHPTIGWTIRQLWEHLQNARPYVALVGRPGSGKTVLAERLASEFSGRLLVDPADAVPPLTLADPPSHVFQRQIQFLDSRSQVLSPTAWGPADSLVVSDFFFDQAVYYAAVESAAASAGLPERREFVQAVSRDWVARRLQVVSPKLLVILDREDPTTGGSWNCPDEPWDLKTTLPIMGRLSARTHEGPVLYAPSTDPDSQYQEIAAAITAMN